MGEQKAEGETVTPDAGLSRFMALVIVVSCGLLLGMCAVGIVEGVR